LGFGYFTYSKVKDDIIFNYSPDLRSIVNSLQAYQSYPYPLICKKIIKLNCKRILMRVMLSNSNTQRREPFTSLGTDKYMNNRI
jgi:hypothetical protein